MASELKCTTAACLVDSSVDDLLTAQAAVIAQGQQGGIAGLSPVATFLRPVVDGTLVTRDFKVAVAAGEQLEGPSKKLIFSTMKEEGALAISGL